MKQSYKVFSSTLNILLCVTIKWSFNVWLMYEHFWCLIVASTSKVTNQPPPTLCFSTSRIARGGRRGAGGGGRRGRREGKSREGEELLHSLIFSLPPSPERGFVSSSHRKVGEFIFLLSIQQMKIDLSNPVQPRNKVDSVSQRASQTKNAVFPKQP